MHSVEPKQAEEKLVLIANAVRAHMSHCNSKHILRALQGAENRTTASEYAEARADRCQKRTKDAEKFMPHAKMMRTTRWQDRNLMW